MLYPARRARDRGAARRAASSRFGLSLEAAAAAVLLRVAGRRHRHRPTHRIVPNLVVVPAAGRRAGADDGGAAEPRVGDRRARRLRVPARRRARLSGRDGDGRRQARAADGRGARLDRAGRAPPRDDRRRSSRRSCCSPGTVAKARKMAIPFAPFLALGSVVALFAGDAIVRALSSHLLGRSQGIRAGCRYLIRGIWSPNSPTCARSPDGRSGHVGRRSRPAAVVRRRRVVELVADLIGATGLVPADRLALVRGRAGARSFSEALVDEGLASSEGVARMLAARHRLPLVDLRLAGVAGDASALIPLHVLRRAVALPYRLEGDDALRRDRGSAERARDRRAAAGDAAPALARRRPARRHPRRARPDGRASPTR